MVHPAYAEPCVPAGHVVVEMASAPPGAFTVTTAVAVVEPEAFVAVRVYVVVVAGVTAVNPLAELDVKFPGDMEMLVAPVLVQLRVLLAPAVMLAGTAEKELITGLFAVPTVIVTVDLTDPTALVAVSV